MEFQAYDIGLIPVIVILVEVFKRMLKIPARWLPLISIILGQVAAFVFISPDDAKFAVLAGLVMAFSAMGTWSGVKNTVEKR